MGKKIRGTTEVEINEFVDVDYTVDVADLDEDDLVEHLRSLGYEVDKAGSREVNSALSTQSPVQEADRMFKYLCDKCDVSYLTPISILLEEVKDKLLPVKQIRKVS